MTDKSVRVRIEGRVQGVWFRAWTREQAMVRGLDGWVCNQADGTVEAVFSGPQSLVDDMLNACHQGPTLARVDGVHVQGEPKPVDPGFVLR